MPRRYRPHPDEDAASRESVALWRRYCASRGVSHEDIAAGTATLDSDARTGQPVFPPVTVGYPTKFGPGHCRVVVGRSGGAACEHKREHEAFEGQQEQVEGQRVTVAVRNADRDRSELADDVREVLDEEEEDARTLADQSTRRTR